MPHIHMHPAPGLGDLLPGFFVVPNNPIKGNTGLGYVPHFGELMPGKFSVPENPIIRGLSGCGIPGRGNSCGCGGGCGMGSLGAWQDYLPDFSGALPDFSTWGITNWALLGGGAFLLIWMMTPGGSQYSQAKRSLKAEFKERSAQLREFHRGSKRARRYTGSAIAQYAPELM